MPSLALDSPTVAFDCSPHFPSITDTPPPAFSLAKSSVAKSGLGSQGSTSPTPVSMPSLGQVFCGFHLEETLGQGTFARVYRAKQPALANRDVAVKVSLKATLEPERLARLNHTNVVPVYSVHEAGPAQVICMPFLGRQTLANAIEGRRSNSHAQAGLSTRKAIATKKGSSVAGSRTRTNPKLPDLQPKTGTRPVTTDPSTSIVGDVPAILLLLQQLADGLAHAHERGVLHLDLKPANVLIADTGEPMLLDFNLSFAEAEGKRELVGGTIPYMAPEQLLDLKQRGKGSVDARTDLYSLGVIAFELLTGKHPFPVSSRSLTEFDTLIAARAAGAPSVRVTNPDIPAAVASIVRKLLAPDPADRYQSARDLKEDLDRQLSHRPLAFAPDRSIPERLGKWWRRNPRTMVAVIVAVCLTVAGGAGAYAFNESEKRAVREAESQVRATHDGLAEVRLDLILPDPATRSRGLKNAMQLLAAFDLPQDPHWQSGAAFQRVPSEQQAALAGDLGELLLLVAHARLEEGKSDTERAGAVNDARILNELARGCFGDSPPPLVAKQREEIDGTPIPVAAPKTARDYFLEGATQCSRLRFDVAIRSLEKAVAAQPDHAAANFLLARCRDHLGHFDAAVERYRTAAALLPRDPRPIYQSGVAMGVSGQPASAEEAFSTAITMNPDYAEAYVARGIARIEQADYRNAEKDLTKALELGAPKLQVHSLRALARNRMNDTAGETEDRKVAAALPAEREGDFLTRGYTRMRIAPREALADFQKAIAMNPALLTARRNQVRLLVDELRDNDAAMKATDELVKYFPEFREGRALRALILARLGKRDAALAEAEACQKLLASQRPEARESKVVYRLALVHAVAARNAEERQVSIKLLKEAFRSGFNDFANLDRDRDVDSIRDEPEYRRAVESAKVLAK